MFASIFPLASEQLLKMKNKNLPPKLEVKNSSGVSSGSDNEKETPAPAPLLKQ